jgi:cell division protein FtsI (penicillin-binding protein 3)
MPKLPSRITLIAAGFVAAALAVVARAAYVQLYQGSYWRARAAEQQTTLVTLPAPRGAIYDRNGVALALSQETYGVGVAPKQVRDRALVADRLAAVLGRPKAELRRLVASDRVWNEWPGPYQWTQVASLKGLRGVYLLRRLQRYYPKLDFGARIVGRVDARGRGVSGLERALDTLLAGHAGTAVMLRDRNGRTYPSPSRPVADPDPGTDVFLTIDADLQEIAERALAEAVAQTRAAGGDVVILQPATGEVLALAAVRPGVRGAGLVSDAFEPGSTAKVFTAAALLRTGKARADDTVFGENGTYRLGDRVIHDVHPNGRLTLADVIRVSSNIGIAKFGSRLANVELYEAFRDFGFGTPTGVDLPAEAAGRLRNPRSWTAESPASLAMGYEVAVTPLQLAAAYGALANGGVLLEPALVREVRRPDGGVAWRHAPRPVRRAVSPAVASLLTHMMVGAVEEGTARRAALGTYNLAGKTGTARRNVGGRYLEGHYTATFVGLFRAEDPQLVLVVKIDDPQGEYFGGTTAAPVVRTILEAALATPAVALDRGRLIRREAPGAGLAAGPAATAAEAGGPVVVAWPPGAAPGDSAAPWKVVPDVAGLGLRAAARTLHRNGFEVRIEGWGRAVSTSPPAGVGAPPGATVVVHAEQRDAR